MSNQHENFIRAFTYANEMHWDQKRKDSDIQYIVHPMAVASLVMENEGNPEEVAAAFLHNVLEDNEAVSRQDIEDRFGSRVAEIVEALSDANPSPGEEKASWKERKLAYINHLQETEDLSVLKVSNADKLHNARSILSDLMDPDIGSRVWDRFKASRAETLWYYESLADIFMEKSPTRRLAVELKEVVDKLQNFDSR